MFEWEIVTERGEHEALSQLQEAGGSNRKTGTWRQLCHEDLRHGLQVRAGLGFGIASLCGQMATVLDDRAKEKPLWKHRQPNDADFRWGLHFDSGLKCGFRVESMEVWDNHCEHAAGYTGAAGSSCM